MKKIFITIAIVLFVQTLYAQSDFILQAPFKSNYYISWTFGYYENYSTKKIELHEGIDFAVRTGTPVYAACEGTITEVSYNTELGNYIIIKHSNGFKTCYCNLQSFRRKIGEKVSTDDIIASSGNTGISAGPHLCFRLYDLNNVAINPTKYFKELPEPNTPPDKELENSSFQEEEYTPELPFSEN